MGWFIILVVPPIVFFIALMQLLMYWGLVQWAVAKFAVVFFVSAACPAIDLKSMQSRFKPADEGHDATKHTMSVSGAEAVVAAACPFLGNVEAQMLIAVSGRNDEGGTSPDHDLRLCHYRGQRAVCIHGNGTQSFGTHFLMRDEHSRSL